MAPTENGLFQGKQFFVLARVPSRSDLVARIEANGGRILKIEGPEDYKIADHARKDCPLGSISWKFVQDALRLGEIPKLDNYRIGSAAGPQRPTGSSTVPGIRTRNAFTAEEDLLLWEFVQAAERRGEHIRGNTLYQEFQKKYPRHTFQSWRDRYIKVLVYRPPPDRAGPSAVGSTNLNPRQDNIGNGETLGQTDNPASPAILSIRNTFTAEEDLLLWDFVKERERDGARPKGRIIYEEFAKNNQRHTWQSWRDRYVKILTRRPPEECAEQTDEQQQIEDPDLEQDHVEAQDRIVQSVVITLLSGNPKDSRGVDFTGSEIKSLLNEMNDIESVAEDRRKEAWALWEKILPSHDAAEWALFYKSVVLPEYERVLKGASAAEEEEEEEEVGVSRDAGEGADGPELQRDDVEVDGPQKARSPLKRPSPLLARERELDTSGEMTGLKRVRRSEQDQYDLTESEDEVRPRSSRRVFKVGDDRSEGQGGTKRRRVQAEVHVPVVSLASSPAALPEPTGTPPNDEEDSSPNNDHASVSQGTSNQQPLGIANRNLVQASQERTQWAFDQAMLKKHVDSLPRLSSQAPLPDGDKLTEANLASQQAEHRTKSFRANDLEVDDVDQDQSEYAKLLQRMLGLGSPLKQVNDTPAAAAAALPSRSCVDEHLMDALDGAPENATEVHRIPGARASREADAFSFRPDGTVEEALPSAQARVEQAAGVSLQLDQAKEPISDSQGSPDDQPIESQLVRYLERQRREVLSPVGAGERVDTIQPEHSLHTGSERTALALNDGDDGDDDFEIDFDMPEPPGGFTAEDDETHGPFDVDSQSQNVARPGSPEDTSGNVEALDSALHSPSALSLDHRDLRLSQTAERNLLNDRLDTQAILAAETQQVDLDLPFPDDDSFGSLSVPPPPPLQHGTQSGNACPSRSASSMDEMTPVARLTKQNHATDDRPLDTDEIEPFVEKLAFRGYSVSDVVDALDMTTMRPGLAELVLILRAQGRPVPEGIAGIWTKEEDEAALGQDARQIKALEEKHGWDGFLARRAFLEQYAADSQ